jgi:D-3-phosphoglycerate dehydrogenase
MRIALTTTSFQDTPGRHHDLLKASGLEIVSARGPLSEDQMLDLVTRDGGLDGLLNGDDAITGRVIDAALPRLKVISKYGIGLDSIDVAHATARRVPVLFTPGVNHTTVAEHALGLMIALSRDYWPHLRDTKYGQWTRRTGTELAGKTLAVLGVGRVGKAVIERARAFDMTCVGYDQHWDEAFAKDAGVTRAGSIEEAVAAADVITLHLNLSDETRGIIGRGLISRMSHRPMIINTARGGLVHEDDVAEACRSGKLRGYAADVLEHEPLRPPHPFQQIDNIIVTPHIGSRTFESVERQALRAVKNLVNYLQGDPDFIQANRFN